MNDNLIQSSIHRRILAFGFDFCLFATISGAILAPFFDLEGGKHLILDDGILGPAFYIFLFFIFCVRDLKGGSGPGKRIFNLKVLNDKMKLLHGYQHIVRNLGLCIWPIDALFILGKNRKRLLEYPAESKVYAFKNRFINFKHLAFWIILILIILLIGKLMLEKLGIPPN